MSMKISFSYPEDAKLYQKGTGPCPKLKANYLYSDEQSTWLAIGDNLRLSVKKRLPKPAIDKIDESTYQSTLEVE